MDYNGFLFQNNQLKLIALAKIIDFSEQNNGL